MSDDSVLKQEADTIKATVDAINAVASLLSSDRTVVLEINNVSNATLTLGPTHHDHGGFGTPPPFTISPQKTVLFSSQSSGVLEGTQGSVTYDIDGVNIFTIIWDVPFIGNNSCDDIEDGVSHNRFVGASIAGNGNHAQMRFMLGSRSIPFSVKEILGTDTGTNLSRGLRQLFPATLHSLRAEMGIPA